VESVPDKLRVLGTGFGRQLPSHGRGHWFNPSRAHHFILCYFNNLAISLGSKPPVVTPFCHNWVTVRARKWQRFGGEREGIQAMAERQLPRFTGE